MLSSSVVSYLLPDEAFNESELNESSSRGADEFPLHPKGGRICSRKPCLIIVLAALASVAAIFMLISMCSVAQRKGRPAVFARRKLSDDKPSSSKGLPACGGTQQETDGSSFEEDSTSDPSRVSGPSPKRRKRDSDEVARSSEGGPEAPETRVVPGTQQAGWSPAEMFAADALLVLQQGPAVAEQTSGAEVEEQEEEPRPSTSSADVYAPSAAPGSQGGDAVSRPFQQPSPRGSLEAAAGPSASGERRPAEGPIPTPPNHIFFRLPRLEPGAVVRPFDPRLASFYRVGSGEAVLLLRDAQRLLAKESVSQGEAAALVDMAERLAAHCYREQRFPLTIRDSSIAAEAAGLRFLLFDTILSVFSVTGRGPSLGWWQEFAAVIPHARARSPAKHPNIPQARHLNHLRAFCRGLDILKRGERPSNEELYHTKFLLFCADPPLRRFQNLIYDVWREHCPDAGTGQ